MQVSQEVRVYVLANMVKKSDVTDCCQPVHTKDMLEYERTFNVNVRVSLA